MTQKMTMITNGLPSVFLSDQQAPCLSLYQPTHRHHPENEQDPIRFRNMVREMEISLQQLYPEADYRQLLKPFEDLGRDIDFWNHTMDGIAVLGEQGLFQVFALQRSVDEIAIVADSFHTKPLRRLLQSVDRFQVLGLNQHEIRLFEGNRDALDEIELAPGVPRTIEDALGDELSEKHDTVSSYGGIGAGSAPMHHGDGGKKDQADIDAERFFRAVDRAVLEHHSRPSGLPLILAALPQHHAVFHQVSHNPALMNEGINVNPDSLSIDELRERAWLVIEPQYQARLASLADEFAQANSHELGSDDIEQVAKAAAAGRVARLLIDADRLIAGRLNNESGFIKFGDLSNPLVDDLLDDLSELVVKMSGQVFVVASDMMPTQTGVAATYRY